MSVVQQVRSKWIPAIETVRSLFGASGTSNRPIAFEVNLCSSHQKGKATVLRLGSCTSLCNQENNTHCVTERGCLFINTSEVNCWILDPCFSLVQVFHHPSCWFLFVFVASVICIQNRMDLIVQTVESLNSGVHSTEGYSSITWMKGGIELYSFLKGSLI